MKYFLCTESSEVSHSEQKDPILKHSSTMGLLTTALQSLANLNASSDKQQQSSCTTMQTQDQSTFDATKPFALKQSKSWPNTPSLQRYQLPNSTLDFLNHNFTGSQGIEQENVVNADVTNKTNDSILSGGALDETSLIDLTLEDDVNLTQDSGLAKSNDVNAAKKYLFQKYNHDAGESSKDS